MSNVHNQSPLASGDLDPGFGDGGRIYLSVEGYGETVKIQPDNKIVVGFRTGPGFGLARLQPDGSPDMTFGIDGYVIGEFGQDNEITPVTDLHLLRDGRILLVAEKTTSMRTYPALAMFHRDGSADTTFGQNGQQIVQLKPDGQDELQTGFCRHSTVLAGDKILLTLTPQRVLNDRYEGLLIRLEPNGSLDTTFNSRGYVPVPYKDTGLTTLEGVAVQADGRYLVAGTTRIRTHTFSFMTRIHENGGIDATFGELGYATVEIPGVNTYLGPIALTQDGKTVGAGHLGGAWYTGRGLLSVIDTEGQPDAQFNNGMPALLSIPQMDVSWRDVIVQNQHLTLVGGGQTSEGITRYAIARYLPSGQLDSRFGQEGVIRGEPRVSIAAATLRQHDANIITVGTTEGNGERVTVSCYSG